MRSFLRSSFQPISCPSCTEEDGVGNTCVGYGNIAPKTALGRFITIPYAVIGIPLTLLTITHLGAFMATVFRFLYKNVFCGVCCAPFRRRRRGRRDSASTVENDVELGAGETTTTTTAAAGDDVVVAGGPPCSAAVTEVDRVVAARRRRTAAERVRQSYRVMVEWRRGITERGGGAAARWRRGITNALYTEDNLQVQVPVYVSLLLIAGYVSVGALMFGLWESSWDFLIGSYFCFVTLSTIGFGDFVPGTSPDAWASQEKLCLCSAYLICGLALLAMCFDLMQEEARNTFRRWGRQLGLLAQPPAVTS